MKTPAEIPDIIIGAILSLWAFLFIRIWNFQGKYVEKIDYKDDIKELKEDVKGIHRRLDDCLITCRRDKKREEE